MLFRSDGYMQWIHDKTATLLSASCDIGALLGRLKTKERSALHSYGVYLGLAFQIADDVLDYTGSEAEVGKPIGHDLLEGFATLPLMLAMEDDDFVKKSQGLLMDGRALTANEALRVASLVRDSDAPRRALERATALASQAREKLVDVERGPANDALAALTTYVVSRRF